MRNVKEPGVEDRKAANLLAWMGNSKVVTKDGAAQRMYHATLVWDAAGRALGDFDSFNRLASVEVVGRQHSIDTLGSWFSSEACDMGAGRYVGNQNHTASAIYPVYLKIERPYETTFEGMMRRMRALCGRYDSREMIGKDEVDALRLWLTETGRDGVRLRYSGGEADVEFKYQTVWIALGPNQVKSAIGNSGRYIDGSGSLTDMSCGESA